MNKQLDELSKKISPDENFTESVSIEQFTDVLLRLDETQRQNLIQYAETLLKQESTPLQAKQPPKK